MSCSYFLGKVSTMVQLTNDGVTNLTWNESSTRSSDKTLAVNKQQTLVAVAANEEVKFYKNTYNEQSVNIPCSTTYRMYVFLLVFYYILLFPVNTGYIIYCAIIVKYCPHATRHIV